MISNLRYSKLILFSCSFLSISFSQTFEIDTYLINNKKNPFWLISNKNGLFYNGSIINLKFKNNQKNLDYGINAAVPLNPSNKIIINTAFASLNKSNFLQ